MNNPPEVRDYLKLAEWGSRWPIPLTQPDDTLADLYSRYEAGSEATPVCGDAHNRRKAELAKRQHPAFK